MPPDCASSLRPYVQLGYPLLRRQRGTGRIIAADLTAAARTRWRGHTTVFAGQSGVGKSSLTRLPHR